MGQAEGGSGEGQAVYNVPPSRCEIQRQVVSLQYLPSGEVRTGKAVGVEMNIKFFSLFIACVIYGMFVMYINIKSRDAILSYLTLYTLYASIIGAAALLSISFYYLF